MPKASSCRFALARKSRGVDELLKRRCVCHRPSVLERSGPADVGRSSIHIVLNDDRRPERTPSCSPPLIAASTRLAAANAGSRFKVMRNSALRAAPHVEERLEPLPRPIHGADTPDLSPRRTRQAVRIERLRQLVPGPVTRRVYRGALVRMDCASDSAAAR